MTYPRTSLRLRSGLPDSTADASIPKDFGLTQRQQAEPLCPKGYNHSIFPSTMSIEGQGVSGSLVSAEYIYTPLRLPLSQLGGLHQPKQVYQYIDYVVNTCPRFHPTDSTLLRPSISPSERLKGKGQKFFFYPFPFPFFLRGSSYFYCRCFEHMVSNKKLG